MLLKNLMHATSGLLYSISYTFSSSPVGEKQGKGKGKKPQRSAKEKVVMVVEK